MTIVEFNTEHCGFEYDPSPAAKTVMNYTTGKMQSNQDTRIVNQYSSFTGLLWKKGIDASWAVDQKVEQDYIIMRYADVLLNLAECYNELGEQEKAIACVNQVRGRAGAALLNSNTFTQVTGQDDLRRRIRNERRWEFNGEGINFFDEMRWGTWKESKFFAGSGLKQMWGEPQYVYAWSGDQVYTWPAPWSERQLNEDLTLADGWKD